MRHLAGLIDREALLQMARAKPGSWSACASPRPTLTIGQQALVAGQRRCPAWFERSVAAGRVPYRKLSLALGVEAALSLSPTIAPP